ncbi:putative transposase [Caminicella sporogenes DSM 14501]|uniref:Putative transposase n=1 Tax=Caminicella sporogenes DSM 14501 TaxID=1121266 RepID=A0A1M6PVQ2_9FIRM|nr:integrase [Caminicella sporogenes]SHK12073.1 putative transposase [Caminicella sporogenes DSM 14501]
MCKIFNVLRSAYYRWLKNPITKKKQEDNKILSEIKRVHKESRETYGIRRVTAQLNKEGISCGRNKVQRLMRENNIYCRTKRKFKATTNSNHSFSVAPNLLDQNFTAERPGQIWCGDITYVATEEGWLYLAAIEDLYTRKIVGWSMSSSITRHLTISALDQALKRETPDDGVIFHSDRGVQYAAYDYQNRLKEYNMIQSMSRKGNCYDNALMELFFSSLKKDVIFSKKFKTRSQARLEIVDYIEIFYNSKRLHSSLGNKSSREFKNDYYKEIAA